MLDLDEWLAKDESIVVSNGECGISKSDLFIWFRKKSRHKIFYFELLQNCLKTKNFLVKILESKI